MAMMAITTSNSIRVKAREERRVIGGSSLNRERHARGGRDCWSVRQPPGSFLRGTTQPRRSPIRRDFVHEGVSEPVDEVQEGLPAQTILRQIPLVRTGEDVRDAGLRQELPAPV